MTTASSFGPPAGGTPPAGFEPLIERTFPTGEPARLAVENVRGRIHVAGWDRPEVQLRAEKLPDPAHPARYHATRVEIVHQGNTIVARTVLDRDALDREGSLLDELVSRGFGLIDELLRQNTPAEVVYEVRVPRATELELRGVSCPVTVEDVQGTIRVRTVSGACAVARARGDLRLNTVSGALTARDVEGRLEAKSVSGGVRIAGRLAPLEANTVSGAIEVAGPLAPSSRYAFGTVSGSLTLHVPAATGASISARGVSLGVHSGLPCQVTSVVRRPGDRRWEGRLGDGSASVRFRTVSGQLRIYPLSDAGAASAAPPAPVAVAAPEPPVAEAPPAAPEGGPAEPIQEPPARAEQLRILQALQRGELNPDDALRQIQTLHRERHESQAR